MANSPAAHSGMAVAQHSVATIERLLSCPETSDFMFDVLASAFDVLHNIDPCDMPQHPVLKRAANRGPILNSQYLAAKRRHQFVVFEGESDHHIQRRAS